MENKTRFHIRVAHPSGCSRRTPGSSRDLACQERGDGVEKSLSHRRFCRPRSSPEVYDHAHILNPLALGTKPGGGGGPRR